MPSAPLPAARGATATRRWRPRAAPQGEEAVVHAWATGPSQASPSTYPGLSTTGTTRPSDLGLHSSTQAGVTSGRVSSSVGGNSTASATTPATRPRSMARRRSPFGYRTSAPTWAATISTPTVCTPALATTNHAPSAPAWTCTRSSHDAATNDNAVHPKSRSRRAARLSSSAWTTQTPTTYVARNASAPICGPTLRSASARTSPTPAATAAAAPQTIRSPLPRPAGPRTHGFTALAPRTAGCPHPGVGLSPSDRADSPVLPWVGAAHVRA